jgi:hypothetical protein
LHIHYPTKPEWRKFKLFLASHARSRLGKLADVSKDVAAESSAIGKGVKFSTELTSSSRGGLRS